jgi:hypothetical protein
VELTERFPISGETRRSTGKLDALRASSPSTGRETKVSTSCHDSVSHTAFTTRCVSVLVAPWLQLRAVTKTATARAERDFIRVWFQSTTRRLMTREAALVCCALWVCSSDAMAAPFPGTLRDLYILGRTKKSSDFFQDEPDSTRTFKTSGASDLKRPPGRLELCHRNFQPS